MVQGSKAGEPALTRHSHWPNRVQHGCASLAAAQRRCSPSQEVNEGALLAGR